MKFRGRDSTGNLYFGKVERRNLKIESQNFSLKIELDEYIGEDKKGQEVYMGDTVILPKKTFHWSWGESTKTNGEEFTLSYEPSKFTRGQIQILVHNSVLKKEEPT